MFEEHTVTILILSIVSVLLISLLKNKSYKFETSKLLWFVQAVFTVFILITGEISLSDWLAETTYLSYIKTGFDILWWLVPAYLLNLAMEPFVWTPLEERTWQPILIPNIVRIFVAEIIYSIAILGIIIYIYESPIIALILLLQLVIVFRYFIKIYFPCLAINIERPFRLGDWVKIGDIEESQVIDITEQMTSLRTRNNYDISIPNNIVLQSTVKNFCFPDEVYLSDIKIKIAAVYPSERVKKILLDALLSVDSILKEPAPVVLVSDINEDSVTYTMSYCDDDYAGKIFVKDAVLTRVWFHVNQAGINLNKEGVV
ncbi:mechanosensitive ion channel [Candidatus Halobeggiatoa sp. HSG11]|nr:mechanosensitive ion channel [Candidatus Halobeggiatoa sp. HSG11]